MRKKQTASPATLARRGAHQEARKAANMLAKAIRLGRTPLGLVEAGRGECMRTQRDQTGMKSSCLISGRRFRRLHFEPLSAAATHIGSICSTDPVCVLCMTRDLGLG